MTAIFRSLTRHPVRLVAVTLVLAVAGVLALTVNAAAHPHDAGGGPMMMMGSPGHIERMLELVNASADQRTQIKAIMQGAQTDLKAQHEAGSSLRQQSLQLFTQPTVDARAAEVLRQQMLAQHDQASKRMLQAMLDVSRVLTPDQRQQIGAQIAQRQALMERQRAEREAAGASTK